jgi:tetratricopeptide (TPR) repeat protein
LQRAAAEAPNNPRVWYVLGLLYRIDSKPQQSAEAFQRVLKLDPSNADSHYFLGSLLANQQDLPTAAAEFRAALRLEPLHASAEFGLARTLQRQGKMDEASAALTRFQQLTSANLSFPFSHTYGEEGSLGRAQDAATNAPKVEPMIPVTFSRAWQSSSGMGTSHNNNACLIDVDGDGRAGLLLVGSGPSAVRMFRKRHSTDLHCVAHVSASSPSSDHNVLLFSRRRPSSSISTRQMRLQNSTASHPPH